MFQLLFKANALMKRKTSRVDSGHLGFSLKTPVFKLTTNQKSNDDMESKNQPRKPIFHVINKPLTPNTNLEENNKKEPEPEEIQNKGNFIKFKNINFFF